MGILEYSSRFLNRNKAFHDLKVHKPNYGIVIHGVPIALDLMGTMNAKIIEWLDAENVSMELPVLLCDTREGHGRLGTFFDDVLEMRFVAFF